MGQVLESIYIWVRNIVCYLCFLNVFMQIIPGEGFRKYVRFFGSLILVVVVMEPLGNAASLSDTFEQIWEKESRREAYDELEIQMQGMDELRMQKVDEAYRSELQRQIASVAESYGLHPATIELSFDEEGEGPSLVKRVFIRGTVEEEEEAGAIVEKVKREIVEVYQVDSNHIYINIEE